MYLFVCVYVYDRIWMCVHVHMEARDQPESLPQPLSIFLRQRATLTQELSDLSRLDGQWV